MYACIIRGRRSKPIALVYDQKTKRLHAEGNARLTDADGKISYGEIIDLSDDYRDGFVDSLRVETPDQTRIAAARAERSEGNFTVFQSGVYTACEPCKEDPRKPPLWQVKAARIIHNQTDKMLYFEDASIEFFGYPAGLFPYFSAPDPTVKRKTGFLMPVISTSSAYGFALETPYYIALAPDYDMTLSPKSTTKQGVLMQGEFRQRLENGYYTHSRRRHRPARQELLHPLATAPDPRLPPVARRHRRHRPLQPSRRNGCVGFDAAVSVGCDLLPGLQDQVVADAQSRPCRHGTDRSSLHAVPRRSRRPQLLRSARDPLHGLVGVRPAERDSGYLSCA